MGKDKPNNRFADKEIFSTGEAARICGVSQQTIIRCFDTGRLRGTRVPGSRFRRIPRAELIRFMKANQISTEALEGRTRRILIVDDDDAILRMIRDILEDDQHFTVETARTGYDAGVLTEKFRPHLIILDYQLPDINGSLVCDRVRTHPELPGTKVLMISGALPSEARDKLTQNGVDGFLQKPLEPKHLLDNVKALLAD